MEIYQYLPLTFDLHLDGLHRYEPCSIFKIPTKLYHNWTLLPEVIASCTMALYRVCTLIYMEIYQYLPLTFDLHLDGLHRHEPWYIINIPTKLHHSWTPLLEVITSCTMALYSKV